MEAAPKGWTADLELRLLDLIEQQIKSNPARKVHWDLISAAGGWPEAASNPKRRWEAMRKRSSFAGRDERSARTINLDELRESIRTNDSQGCGKRSAEAGPPLATESARRPQKLPRMAVGGASHITWQALAASPLSQPLAIIDGQVFWPFILFNALAGRGTFGTFLIGPLC
jgi:hypothetical protein